MSGPAFGPEWNPVLVVLGVLVVLVALAMIQWWLGVAMLVGFVAVLYVFLFTG